VHDDHDHPDTTDEDDSPGPLSGEVPAVDGATEEPPGSMIEPEPPVDLGERRGRKRRKRETFEGLPAGELTKVEPPTEDEGVRVLGEPAEAESSEPEPAPEPPAAAEEPPAAAEERAPEPEAEPVAAAEPDRQPEPEPEPEPEAEEEPEAAAHTEDEGIVDDLFARLRAEREASDAGEADAPAEEPEVAPEPEAVDEEPAAEEELDEAVTPFTERDAHLDPVDKELSRRLKRALADEQNEVLDLLRREKPKGVDDLLPEADEHAARWVEVVTEVLTDAASAGATWANGDAGSVTDLADELARSLTAPLRDRIDRSFSAADGNLDDVADRVRALYREWKGQRLTDTSRHYAAAAYARGVFDATSSGTHVHWVVDPLGGRCPDCDDNVLGGDIEKGSEFPTGHTCAPAHPGCRCLVLAAER
jgi:hypothetical protein